MIKLIVLYLIYVEALREGPEVITNQGVVRGKYDTTRNGRTIYAFTGIPYAKPPVGKLRFQPPVPAEQWNDTLDASQPRSMCTQMNHFVNDFTVKGEEDCLYLNVYTPQLSNSNKKLLPVIFYIHGGGLVSGKADSYGPKLLLDREVVLVTANYRLGSLGFITTGDEVVPGNNGLKDQNLALKWTKKHIANFGGDPNLITLFGESAGAACTHYHMLSPLSKNLIKGAILHSNSALGLLSYAPKDQGVRNTKKLGQLLNCPIDSNEEMIDCLRNVDAYEIVKQDAKFMEWGSDPLTPFKVVVEPNTEEAFLVEDPVEIIKSGKAANVPIIVGLTTEDGTIKSANLYSDPNLIEELNNDFERVAPIVMQYQDTAIDKNLVSRKIREFYFGHRQIDNCTKYEVTNMFTDSWALLAQDAAVRLHFKYTKNPVYYFLFGYRSTPTFANVFGNDSHYNYGVSHADELIYLFNFDGNFNLGISDYEPNESDKMMIAVMTTMWVNFATIGNPTPKDDSFLWMKWQSIISNKLEYFFIKNATEMTMLQGLYEERIKFWRDLPIDPRRNAIK